MNFRQEQMMEKRRQNQVRRPGVVAQAPGIEKEKIRPSKPFKEMTGDEYNAYLNSHKLGL